MANWFLVSPYRETRTFSHPTRTPYLPDVYWSQAETSSGQDGVI
jgi:hypothetical protein